MSYLKVINSAIAFLFFACYFYQLVYLIVPLIRRNRPHGPEVMHRYAVLIAARNEQAVIGQLIDSVRAQDYPSELVEIFVVADNCTDSTADVARAAGARVYERFDRENVGKGYALNYLLASIGRDYGDVFDGYMVFDADNLLERGYISAMNRAFSDGHQIVTGYRNSKNFGDNWISAGYSLWFLRDSEFLNHARALLGFSAVVSGTGFMFSREILRQCGGWQFFLLTEDTQFTVHNITRGVRIGYAGDAVLYDEQPVKFRQSWRQRLRWAKGCLQVYRRYGGQLVSTAARGNFSSYDMIMSIMPAFILFSTGFIVNGAAAVMSLFAGSSFLSVIGCVLEYFMGTYNFMLFIGAFTTLTQWRRIHTTAARKILFTFTFPVFMMTYIPISICAIFQKVEWKPIEHKAAVSIKDIA